MQRKRNGERVRGRNSLRARSDPPPIARHVSSRKCSECTAAPHPLPLPACGERQQLRASPTLLRPRMARERQSGALPRCGLSDRRNEYLSHARARTSLISVIPDGAQHRSGTQERQVVPLPLGAGAPRYARDDRRETRGALMSGLQGLSHPVAALSSRSRSGQAKWGERSDEGQKRAPLSKYSADAHPSLPPGREGCRPARGSSSASQDDAQRQSGALRGL
jgi:hypothetical protein